MKIGFYGDSFCMEVSNPHSWWMKYETYLAKIKKHYNADITHLGLGASSYWDLMIKQLPPDIDNLPDVCIFCWTDPNRVYHPDVRNIGSWIMAKQELKDFSLQKITNYKKYDAAREYFTHLFDFEKATKENIAAMYYFDREVLAPIQHKTKIIHLWSFGHTIAWDAVNPFFPSNIEYKYRWQTGVEVRPSLKCFSPIGRDTLEDGDAANHLGSELNNQLVADMIIEAIDNHTNGKLLVKDAMWEQYQTSRPAN